MIRKANKDDIKAICFLSNEINAEHHDAMPNTFSAQGEIDRDADFWLAHMAREESDILLIERRDEIVGMAAVSIPTGPKPSFFIDKRICHLTTIFVASSARRQGFGKKLIRAVEEHAHENGAS